MKKRIWNLALAILLLASHPAVAFPQWLNLKLSGTPRNADGSPRAGFAISEQIRNTGECKLVVRGNR